MSAMQWLQLCLHQWSDWQVSIVGWNVLSQILTLQLDDWSMRKHVARRMSRCRFSDKNVQKMSRRLLLLLQWLRQRRILFQQHWFQRADFRHWLNQWLCLFTKKSLRTLRCLWYQSRRRFWLLLQLQRRLCITKRKIC